MSGRFINLAGAPVGQELVDPAALSTLNSGLSDRNGLCGRNPRSAFIITQTSEAFHGYSIGAAAAKRAVPARPCEFSDYSDGARPQTEAPISCSIDLGRAIYNAQAHKGVGGAGTGACSGDLLLGALAACAQITCQMVAAAMGIPTEAINVRVEGDLDLQGTLGLSKDVPIGFQDIRVTFDVRAPQATAEQLSALRAKTEQYCVVMQTLQRPPKIENKWGS